MHHIQDHSTPSHAVPIYHGPGLLDQFEVYGETYAWQIEVLNNSGTGSRLTLSITDEEIVEVAQPITMNTADEGFINDLYENTAQETLSYIHDNHIEIFQNGEQICKFIPFHIQKIKKSGD